jgi:hypothetical protein
MAKIVRAPHHNFARAEPTHDALRRALLEACELLSVDSIKRAAERAGCDLSISRSGLSQFIEGHTKTLKPEHSEPLERFFFRTPIGRALHSKRSTHASGLDPLIDLLSAADETVPKGFDFNGLYFVYHGSYLRPDMFAIRTMEIACLNEGSIAAEDYVQDNVTLTALTHRALGCIIFKSDLPQIITVSDDNRRGLSLFVATQIVNDRDVIQIVGMLYGITKNLQNFERRCLIRKSNAPIYGFKESADYDGLRQRMIRETGVFTHAELKGGHRDAIDTLAKYLPETQKLFEDPIFNHPRFKSSAAPRRR